MTKRTNNAHGAVEDGENMLTIMEGHHHAMDLADQADRLKRSGQQEDAMKLLAEALEFEKAAALKLIDRNSIEPTRSVLFRSAASLALEIGQVRDAERMIAVALSGDPPPEIAEELRDLLEKVNFQRHLNMHGLPNSGRRNGLTTRHGAERHSMTTNKKEMIGRNVYLTHEQAKFLSELGREPGALNGNMSAGLRKAVEYMKWAIARGLTSTGELSAVFAGDESLPPDMEGGDK